MSTEVYRIRSTMQINAASTSSNNTKLYTSKDELLADLLPMSLRRDRHSDRARNPVARVLIDFWWSILEPYGDRGYPYPLHIAVERHITDTLTGEGRWLNVAWSYEPPKVSLNGEEVSSA